MLQVNISQGYDETNYCFKTNGLDRIILIRSPHTNTKDKWMQLSDIRSVIGID